MKTSNLFDSAAVEMWVDFTVNNIWVCLEALKEWGQIADEANKDLHTSLEKVSNWLRYKTFLVGNSLSLADVFLACSIKSNVQNLKEESLKSLSNLVRWYKLVSNLKEFKAVYGETKLRKD